MRRTLIALAAALAVVAAACSSDGGSSSASAVDTASHDPVTLTITGEWTGEECDKWKEIFPAFTEAYPWATVEPTCNVNDDKMIKQINAGTAPDVAQSFGVDNVGSFCNSGAWQDLTPYIEGADGTDMSQFPEAALTYTVFDDMQCALPFMTDTFGIYYNTDLFDAAGLSEPPATTDELTEYAKQLTEFNADGSIKVAGFVPDTRYYCCALTMINLAYMFDAKFLDDGGQAAFASDPQWAAAFQWQHDFIAEVYGDGDFQTGAEKLTEFISGAGNEWNAQQDLGTGRVAITVDGEWRNAFVPDDLNYDTAPLPVAPGTEDRYGGGSAGGTVLALPKGSPHPAEAWLLLKWLATDTATLVDVANRINNVPTTNAALTSPDLDLPLQFQTFMDIFANPNSGWAPTTAIGLEISDALGQFAQKWETGATTDLQGGLQQAQDQTNDALAQAAI
ncbi:MAG TPA: extracellular solute-binding protein [Actinomycetota bacterium]|nr:extracellular solute-binding protein [Actinomycetota bacterium]